jgi:hypothetical protein
MPKPGANHMTEPKPTLNVRITPNKAIMEINIVREDGDRIAGVTLTADQLDKVMAGLAQVRSQMTPEVPLEFPVGQPTHRHESSNYFFGIDPFSGVPLLSFRSPGFGWLIFGIDEAELQRMVRSLPEAKARLAKPHGDTKQ